MDPRPPATVQPPRSPTTLVTCPPPGIGLLSTRRSAPRRCPMELLVPCMSPTELPLPLRLSRRVRPIPKQKLPCPLVSLRRRGISSLVVAIPRPSVAPPGPAPRPSPWAKQISHFDPPMVILNSEDDMAALVRKRRHKTRRPQLLALKARPNFAEEPERLDSEEHHRASRPHGGYRIHPYAVAPPPLPIRIPRPRHRRGIIIGTNNGANNDQGTSFFV